MELAWRGQPRAVFRDWIPSQKVSVTPTRFSFSPVVDSFESLYATYRVFTSFGRKNSFILSRMENIHFKSHCEWIQSLKTTDYNCDEPPPLIKKQNAIIDSKKENSIDTTIEIQIKMTRRWLDDIITNR